MLYMKHVFVSGGVFIGALVVSYAVLPHVLRVEYTPLSDSVAEVIAQDASSETGVPPVDTRPVVTHQPLPPVVKAIYMSACVAGTPSFREELVRLINETELNAVVIDVKDFSGTISFKPENNAWSYAWDASSCGARDMKTFIEHLHSLGIFVIGRVTVFQDPLYTTTVHPEHAVARASDGAIWKDGKGLSFVDVGAQPYWDHIIALIAESYALGFDEINLDYVRYPSDGNMKDIAFPMSARGPYGLDKPANLEAFFAYVAEHTREPSYFADVRHESTGREKAIPWISIDLFGMTTTNTDDLSIGQVLERALPYVDFIAPMVYPSHYPHGFLGLGNPNDHPYTIVHHAMQAGVRRALATSTSVVAMTHTRIGTSTPALYAKASYPASHFRTWIQDFDYGGDYDAADVRAQIQASEDAGVRSYMIWAPSNRYTRAALRTE